MVFTRDWGKEKGKKCVKKTSTGAKLHLNRSKKLWCLHSRMSIDKYYVLCMTHFKKSRRKVLKDSIIKKL
jgi:hypothetical protein